MSERITGADGRLVNRQGISWITVLGREACNRLAFIRFQEHASGRPDRHGVRTRLPKFPEDTSWWDDPRNCTNGL